MIKIADLITIGITLFFLSFVWAGLLVENVVVALVISLAVEGCFIVVATALRRREDTPRAYDRLALELSIEGPAFLVEKLKSILKNNNFESGFNSVIKSDLCPRMLKRDKVLKNHIVFKTEYK